MTMECSIIFFLEQLHIYPRKATLALLPLLGKFAAPFCFPRNKTLPEVREEPSSRRNTPATPRLEDTLGS